jgi:hypothetical protein
MQIEVISKLRQLNMNFLQNFISVTPKILIIY